MSLDLGTYFFNKNIKTAQLIEMDLQTKPFNYKLSQSEKGDLSSLLVILSLCFLI